MQTAFMASLYYYGIQGGAIFLDDKAIRYKAQKLTLPQQYKDIKILYTDIQKIESAPVFILFLKLTIYLNDNKKFKFLIFNKKSFLQSFLYYSKKTALHL